MYNFEANSAAGNAENNNIRADSFCFHDLLLEMHEDGDFSLRFT